MSIPQDNYRYRENWKHDLLGRISFSTGFSRNELTHQVGNDIASTIRPKAAIFVMDMLQLDTFLYRALVSSQVALDDPSGVSDTYVWCIQYPQSCTCILYHRQTRYRPLQCKSKRQTTKYEKLWSSNSVDRRKLKMRIWYTTGWNKIISVVEREVA
jgi:hypothetical protein